jgi:ATP-dependent DNA helicase Rep
MRAVTLALVAAREIATIHGAKGREWPHVVLVACDEGTLPHARSLEVGFEEVARGEGLEAERRLGYVAFTRAQERLEIHFDAERPSRFLTESGILGRRRAPRQPPPVPQPPGPASPKRGLLARLLGD